MEETWVFEGAGFDAFTISGRFARALRHRTV
jgi:hypothetical protein